jgi:hypothetical protein
MLVLMLHMALQLLPDTASVGGDCRGLLHFYMCLMSESTLENKPRVITLRMASVRP